MAPGYRCVADVTHTHYLSEASKQLWGRRVNPQAAEAAKRKHRRACGRTCAATTPVYNTKVYT